MKRIIVVMAMALLVFGTVFAGCAKPAEEAPTSPTAPTTPTAPVKPIQWRLAAFCPPSGPFVKPTIAWGDQLEERSGGRLKITYYWAESLSKIAGLYDSVASGVSDLSHPSLSMYPARFPLYQALTLPGIFEDNVQSGQTIMALYNKYKEYQDEFLPTTKIIWQQSMGPCNIFSKRPVQTMADLKGMKVANTSKNEIAAWEAVGAVTVPIVVTEQYQALSTGIVEAAGGDFNQMYLWKLYEVTKYRTGNTIGTMRGYPTVMNMDSYNKLPEDIKQIFNELTDYMEMTKRMCTIWEDYNNGTTKWMEDWDKTQGNPPFYYIPDDEHQRWVEAMWPINDAWATEMEAKALPAKAFLEDLVVFAKQYKR